MILDVGSYGRLPQLLFYRPMAGILVVTGVVTAVVTAIDQISTTRFSVVTLSLLESSGLSPSDRSLLLREK